MLYERVSNIFSFPRGNTLALEMMDKFIAAESTN